MKASSISILVLSGLLLAGSRAFAQNPAAMAPPSSTNQLSVQLSLPRTGTPPHAPATLRLFAKVSPPAPAQKGDLVTVGFFANGTPLGTGTAAWHNGIRPDPHSNKPQPMIIVLPGFSFAELTWSNVPSGTYTLTARTTWAGATAVSAPVPVTVLP